MYGNYIVQISLASLKGVAAGIKSDVSEMKLYSEQFRKNLSIVCYMSCYLQ
jgi:hypothetical protein